MSTRSSQPSDSRTSASVLQASDHFPPRHLGSAEADVQAMLEAIGADSLEQLIDQTVPESIRVREPLGLEPAMTESEALARLRAIAQKNLVARSCLGMGYYGTVTPAVIQRNILENPGWYTQYTPYQAEIAQGRLEALLNFQTMVADLTGLELANASMLDEPTAAAEAMAMCHRLTRQQRPKFYVAEDCHPQTIEVIRTRAWSMGMELAIDSTESLGELNMEDCCGILLQYPTTDGRIEDYTELAKKAKAGGAMVVAATDLLALTLLKPPGAWGADVAVGSAQRFGVPMGGGGPHAAFFATHHQHARKIPGRIVGVSKDVHGDPAFRLAIQTREQHIKRDRATSNICTAQVLLAIMAGMYAVYHGPEGLKRIARRAHGWTAVLAANLARLGLHCNDRFFDTLCVRLDDASHADRVVHAAEQAGVNLRRIDATRIGVSFDETTDRACVQDVFTAFGGDELEIDQSSPALTADSPYDPPLRREEPFMTEDVFHQHHQEHEMLRYLHRLQARDLSLTTSMIPLGSCTMKLNATSEMLPVTWPEFTQIHPYAPESQQAGYRQMIEQLERWLATITGFADVSMQPNAGSQGEYAGLLAIRRYHEARGDPERTVCLIPTSAHGTNPASAVIAGFDVVPVKCNDQGDIDVADLTEKAEKHADRLGALMITYPSTHGVFEAGVREICEAVHGHGGQVYMDGANLNAQLGLTTPGHIGADVCHLNLHKTFCIPHGGGGPGMGPIGVAEHLVPFLPGDPLNRGGATGDSEKDGPDGSYAVSAAPWGSPSILPISWMYIAMMGADGLTRATQLAILNANYMAHRLKDHFPIVYSGSHGRVAHEFIVDCRGFEEEAGVKIDDIAKRLMDFGFHAPTMSWPVAGTLMIEPTESESKAELDRFCDAMIGIRQEIQALANGQWPADDNPLKHAPHTAGAVAADAWPHAYDREQAAFPAERLRQAKYWPPVGRIDNPYGDRHLVCTCGGVEEMAAAD